MALLSELKVMFDTNKNVDWCSADPVEEIESIGKVIDQNIEFMQPFFETKIKAILDDEEGISTEQLQALKQLVGAVVDFDWGKVEIKSANGRYYVDSDETEITSPLISTKELSEILQVPRKTIEHWVTHNHKNIPFIRLGDRTVRFNIDSIRKWLKELEDRSQKD